MSRNSGIPPGPRYPGWIQALGFWSRPLPYFERCRARYGKRFTLRLPTVPPFVVLSDPSDVKEVFMAPPDVLHPGSGVARVLEPVLGSYSLIVLDEDPHMEQRKLLLPALHGEKIQRLAGVMREVAEQDLASWPRGEPVELHPRFQKLTLEIILRSLFGLGPGPRLDALRDKLAAALAYGDSFVSLVPPQPGNRLSPLLERVGPYATFKRGQREADRMIFELIEERRRDPADRDDILSLLLEARHEDGSPMSGQEIRDELMTLLVAGHETTASALAWAFERLPQHPEVVERLREEIDAGDGDDYLTATIYETLRDRPVLPTASPRLAMKPIEVGGWSYPAGVILIPNSYLIHHDPEIYDDPYAFRPERFLDEAPGTYTWFPFGGGRRRCVGSSFAMVELKIIMSAMLKSLDIVPDGGGREVAARRNITVRPSRGTRVVLRDRVREPALPAA
ncbi:MAG TPA: cytochrome P450 [Thermoleophilaceae bacterium]